MLRVRNFLRHFGLITFYLLNMIFTIIFIAVFIAILSLLLIFLGILPGDFFLSPLYGFLGIIFFSLIITFSNVIMIFSLFVKPIKTMSKSMLDLANGNFETRIDIKNRFSPEEIKEFEKNYNKTAEYLSSVEILRNDFLNDFSHEFKTPIVSIKGFAELLQNGNLSEDDRVEFLKIIVDESERLADLSSSISQLNKITSQTKLLNTKVFDISEQLRQSIILVQSKWMDKNIDFEINVQNAMYAGDENLLKQVWINILDNAIKFSKDFGKIEILCKNSPDLLRVEITDYGIGIEEKDLARIFDKFYQSDKSRSQLGNGIGLSVVKKIVELHNGKIIAKSKINEKTTFEIFLPK